MRHIANLSRSLHMIKYMLLSILCIMTFVCAARADPCVSLTVNTLAQYTAATTTPVTCMELTIIGLNLTHITVTGPFTALIVQQCPLLETITVIQTPVPPANSPNSLIFIGNPRLIDYTLELTNATVVYLSNVPYPMHFNATIEWVVAFDVVQCSWSNLDPLVPYTAVTTVVLQVLANITDFTVLARLPALNAIQLTNLPGLTVLPDWTGKNLTSLSLNNAPLTTLTGLEGVQSIGTLSIQNMPALRDITALAHTVVTTVVWGEILHLCCPSPASGFYTTWPQALVQS